MGRLGDTLRDRRRSLGISIDQAEKATRIRGSFLKALEDGEYARLPDPGYVRGFISSYGRMLGLDTPPLLALYRSETGSSRGSDLNLPQIEEAVAPTGLEHAVPVKAAMIVAVSVVVLALVSWLVFKVVSGPDAPPPEPAPLSETTKAPEAVEQEPETQSTPTQTISQTVPFTLVVGVEADGASWLEITVDGKSAYTGTLTGGQKQTFEVTTSAKIGMGRPSVVTITRDGKDVPVSGGKTTVLLEAEPAE